MAGGAEMMAAIDKFYGTLAEYDCLYTWIEGNNPDYLKHFYPRDEDKDPQTNRVIAMFPENVDMWLLNKCPWLFVQKQIREQYDIELPPEMIAFEKWAKEHKP